MAEPTDCHGVGRRALFVIVATLLALSLTVQPVRAFANDELVVSDGTGLGVTLEDEQQADTVDKLNATEATPEVGEGKILEEGEASGADEQAEAADSCDAAPAEAQESAAQSEGANAGSSDPTQADPLYPELPEDAMNVVDGTYVIQSDINLDRVVDAAGVHPAEGANVATWAYNGGDNQSWDVEQDEASGWYHVYVHQADGSDRLALGTRADSTNVCLVAEPSDGATLWEVLWAFVKAEDDACRLVNAAYKGLCLDVSGADPNLNANLILWEQKKQGTQNQWFHLIDRYPCVAPSDEGPEGAYNLVIPDQDRMIDVSGASRDNGANVVTWCANNGRNQRIYLEPDGAGYYVAWTLDSGKVLDVAGGSILRGTNILQWEYKGSDNQKWALYQDNNGAYQLVSKGTGLTLGVFGNDLCSNVAGTSASDLHALKSFSLIPAALIDEGSCLLRSAANRQLVCDVDHASTGSAAMLLWLDTAALNQRYEFVATDQEGAWRIRTASSGGWLTLVNGMLRQEGNGATRTSASNTWHINYSGGSFVLVSDAAGQALGAQGSLVAGAKLVGLDSVRNAPLGFAIEYVPLIPNGLYFINNTYGKYLEVANLSIDEGANVQMGNRAGSLNQLFRIEQCGTSCRVINALSGMALTADGSASVSNVTQRSVSDNALQLWRMRIADGGRIRFESVSNRGVSLDAWGGGSTAGTNVGLYDNNTSAAQAWSLVALPPEVPTAWQSRVVNAAKSTPTTAGGLCALWVSNVFRNAGVGSYDGDARDLYHWYCWTNDVTALRPGMIVAVSNHGHTWAGSIWGHVCVYVGDGMIMDSVGKVRTMSLFDWAAWYGNQVTVKWGWMGNRAL